MPLADRVDRTMPCYVGTNPHRMQAFVRYGITGPIISCRITNLFDRFGDDTQNPREAMAFVCELPDGRFLTGEVDSHERNPTELF